MRPCAKQLGLSSPGAGIETTRTWNRSSSSGGRRDGDGDGSGDFGAHFVGPVVVSDANGVGESGLTQSGGLTSALRRIRATGPWLSWWTRITLAHDQVVGQFHPDDDVGSGRARRGRGRGRSGKAAADPFTGGW